MVVTNIINQSILMLNHYASLYLMPAMITCLVFGTLMKLFIYYVSKKEAIISEQVEKRIHLQMEGGYPETAGMNFPDMTKFILDKTFHDYFIMRDKNKRRKFDSTASFLDRVFYLDEGTNILFSDTIKQTHYYANGKEPNYKSISSFAFSSNQYFNNLFGIVSLRAINDVLLILPGLFIIGGIFGTFLGIVNGIPELKGMDPANLQGTKLTLDAFLSQMTFSMNTSVVGIFFSAFFTLINTIFSPKALRGEAYTRFTHSLEFLWRNSSKMPASQVLPELPEDDISLYSLDKLKSA